MLANDWQQLLKPVVDHLWVNCRSVFEPIFKGGRANESSSACSEARSDNAPHSEDNQLVDTCRSGPDRSRLAREIADQSRKWLPRKLVRDLTFLVIQLHQDEDASGAVVALEVLPDNLGAKRIGQRVGRVTATVDGLDFDADIANGATQFNVGHLVIVGLFLAMNAESPVLGLTELCRPVGRDSKTERASHGALKRRDNTAAGITNTLIDDHCLQAGRGGKQRDRR